MAYDQFGNDLPAPAAKSSYDRAAVDKIFQQALGRSGSDAEHQFLQPYVDQGYISPYQIGQYLQGTPEALQTRQAGQLKTYGDTLTAGNEQILRQAADAANSSFAQNGRQFSSGQGAMVLQAGKQLAADQAPMLAGYYGNNAANLNSSYAGYGGGALDRAYNLQDSQTAYMRDLTMYNRQQNDYNNYLNSANRSARNGAIGSTILGAVGAGIGGYYGRWQGAGVGAGIGGRAGGMFGSY